MRKAWIALVGVLLVAPGSSVSGEPVFTEEFGVDDCRFSDRGRNPYFSLEPGDYLVLEGDDDGETVRVRITVTRGTRWITFHTPEGESVSVRTRVVEEREWKDDALVEVSRNYFARCAQTNDIFYFGEDVDIYEDGVIVSHDGAWRAGFDDAQPGMIVPETYLLGSRYFQEIAPGVAMDRVEHVRMDIEMDLPAGEFDDCVEMLETTPLEPGAESRKIYCDGIGLVQDGVAELVAYRIGLRVHAPWSHWDGR